MQVKLDPSINGLRVVGHAAVKQALVEPRLEVVPSGAFSPRLRAGVQPEPREFLASWFSRQVPADHQATKRSLVPAYAQARVQAFEGELRRLAAELAAGLPDECDLVRDYLGPFSRRSMACTIGLPVEQAELLEKVTGAIGKVLARPKFDEAATRAIEASMVVFRRFIEHSFGLDDPPPSVEALEEIAADEERGGIWHAVSTLAHLLSAGLHPTVSGAAFAWIEYQARPELRDALRTGALSAGELASEALRLCPPFPVAHRWAQESFELHGHRLEKGAYVCLDLEAANRDPTVFEQPDQIMRRAGALNLAFGHGAHHCVGAALARLQVQVALETLHEQERPFVPSGPPSIVGKGSFGRLLEVRALACRKATPGAVETYPMPAARPQEVEAG